MKQLKIIFSLAFLTLISFQIEAQHNHDSHDHGTNNTKTKKAEPVGGATDIIMVYGNCEMCKRRIEGSLNNAKGIHSADWNVETKVLTVKYDMEVISKDDIKKKVAEVGHDTDKFLADQKVYNNLPGCCQYERPNK